MEMWKRNGNATILLFSLKGLEIVHHEIKVQVNTIPMAHFKSILFHKSGPGNKQCTYQSINQYKPQQIQNKTKNKNKSCENTTI